MSELYTLPDGWEWKKLEDIGRISTGKTPPKVNKEFYEEGTIRFIKPPNLQNSYNIQKTESDEFVTEDGAKKSTLLPKNTLMVCCIGSLGKFALSNENVITNQQINSIIFYEDIISYKYGYYYGFMLEKLLNEVANEAVVKIVNKTIFSNLDIPLPPLEEQKRIVAKLDILFAKIDKAIALHQKNINEANVFMASVLNDVFVKLEEKYGLNILSDSVNNPKKDIVDGPFGSDLKATEYIDSGIPIIRLQNIQRFEFINKDIKFISEEKAKQLHRHTFKKGDIVITKLGVPLGKSCIVPNFLDNGIIVADVIRIRVDESKTLVNYINYAINSPIAINQFSDNSAGATRQRVKLTMVRDLKIPLPNIKTQQKIVSYLDEISQKIQILKQIQKEKMESLKALKASILDQAFKGEL